MDYNLFTRSRLIDLILVFFITGFWDIVLRLMAEGHFPFLGIEKMKWVTVLKEYFEKHTILGAALIAGFVGAVTYPLIMYTFDKFDITNRIVQLIVVFLISGLVGIPMRYSGLFPHLNEHYYKPLDLPYSFMTDAMSGVVVSITLFVLHLII